MKLTQAATKRLAICKADGLCVACFRSLGDSRIVRGCHESCYRQTMRFVSQGKLVEADRIRNGRLLEAEPGGRPPVNPVTQEVNRSSVIDTEVK